MTFWLWVDAQATQIRMVLVVAWLPDTNMTTGCAQILNFCVTFGGNTSSEFNTDPSYDRTMDPDMVLCSSWV